MLLAVRPSGYVRRVFGHVKCMPKAQRCFEKICARLVSTRHTHLLDLHVQNISWIFAFEAELSASPNPRQMLLLPDAALSTLPPGPRKACAECVSVSLAQVRDHGLHAPALWES